MSYQPLARKYRPERFAELLGQTTVSTALTNAIKLKREPTALIFSGVRGVGKTTVARIYAKALNCAAPVEGEPCNQCSHCKSIGLGSHEDVLEIDGASNNGVDEIRALKEAATYIPHQGRYKIYIIDEVHMLSTSAFNALLKILEEPPEKVVFIFATTELQKVPATILSRCLTFYLQKLSVASIVERINYILGQEKIPSDSRAVQVIAREGRGSMRDALTFLDQVIAIGGGEVRWEALTKILTNLSLTPYLKLLAALLRKEIKACMAIVHRLDEFGSEFHAVAVELAKLTRHCFVLKHLGKDAVQVQKLELSKDEMELLHEIALKTETQQLNQLFRFFAQCEEELDRSHLDRFVFENYCFEWCFGTGRAAINASEPQAHKPQQTQSASPRQEVADVPPEPIPAPLTKGVFPDSWRGLLDAWKIKKPLQARKLEEVHPIEYSMDKIVVAVDDGGILGPTLLKKDTQTILAKEFKEQFGFKGEFIAIKKKSTQPTHEPAKPLKRSVLEEKEEEAEINRRNVVAQAENHPLTKAMVEKLGCRIVRTELIQH